jgi:hypothetical protein
MSALGQKQTYAVQKAMSALPPIATAEADIATAPGIIEWPAMAPRILNRELTY